MADPPGWMSIRERLATLLYSQAPLLQRLEALRGEIQVLDCGTELGPELDSMARSAADDREAPFLDVGKDLLTCCDSQLYRETEGRGEDGKTLLEFFECKRIGKEMGRRKASDNPAEN